jgi:quercetin dioxygenase-like cupin family protein
LTENNTIGQLQTQIMTATLIIVGLLLFPVFYNLAFPFKRPHLDNYFTPGQTFTSESEGVTQTVIRQEGDKVYCNLKFGAKAIGPPEHLHLTLDESATVIKGTLTTKVGGQIKKLNAGDRVILPKGIYHTMYNETDSEVIIKSEQTQDYLPVELAYSLFQLYPLMKTGRGNTLKMIAKICVLDELFDTFIIGPPPRVFKAFKKIVKPYARLFGVTPYDNRSRPY